jgi:peptidoglycan/LPS O-acetylase OafA/YrhL
VSESLSASRRKDLDWLRLIAIFILLFFHTGMWFNKWSEAAKPETGHWQPTYCAKL